MTSRKVTCLGCDLQKKRDIDFYKVPQNGTSVIEINKLRSGANKRQKVQPPIESISTEDKLCKNCYDKAKYVPVQQLQQDDSPDDSFFRAAPSSHHQCVFRCRNPSSLTRIPIQIRYLLLMNYKLVTTSESRMCALSSHHQENLWCLVKQVTEPVPQEGLLNVLNLVFELHKQKQSEPLSSISTSQL